MASTGTANTWTDNSTLPGWYASKTSGTGAPAVGSYRAGTGTDTTGALYSFGIAGMNPVTDRALGSVASGTPGNFGVRFQNDTAQAITNITISYTGEQWRNGGHADTNARFNLLPPFVAEHTLIEYWGMPGFSGNRMVCIPFPGGKGKIWHCPSAYMTSDQVSEVNGQGAEGFFSYDMNIDLKRATPDATTPYPRMPKMINFRNPSANVLLFDDVFNPDTEVVNSSPIYISVNPANRWHSFAARHKSGGVINFLDGHARYFTDKYVTNGASTYEVRNGDIIWNDPYRQQNP